MGYPNFARVADELTRVLDVSARELAAIPESRAAESRAPGKWSRKEIIGHLIDSASNNHQRFVRTVQGNGGEFAGYDQDACVAIQRPGGFPWPALLDFWSGYNRFLALVLRRLPGEAARYMVRVGTYTPSTLLWLAGDYVEH